MVIGRPAGRDTFCRGTACSDGLLLWELMRNGVRYSYRKAVAGSMSEARRAGR